MVFSDTEEHQISDGFCLARISKLSAQWKIIFDFKPTEYQEGAELYALLVRQALSDDALLNFSISFPHPNIRLYVEDPRLGGVPYVDLKSSQLPQLHEWSRIEISHVEEEGGNYFLSLSVGGKEVGREGFELGKNLTDVKIYNGIAVFGSWMNQPGFIRGLVVSDKQ